MSDYTAKIQWARSEGETFVDKHYSRGHTWEFDGGVTVPASSSPHVVPPPYSVAANVDPEEAFVAALSSCHMLFFLSIAAKRRYCVESYTDHAYGIMEQDQRGKTALTKVVLRPKAIFSADKTPTREQLEKLHHLAHEQCFIANSVTADVVTEIPAE
ncbi:OsmC family protein [Halioxenophilus aromaticivorans]|uniref:OsmC family protein n=1 Tax=Halioxenophilus aromaticivorans TaxID=1306992 RepID=A0AAV3U5B4_9ALTE